MFENKTQCPMIVMAHVIVIYGCDNGDGTSSIYNTYFLNKVMSFLVIFIHAQSQSKSHILLVISSFLLLEILTDVHVASYVVFK